MGAVMGNWDSGLVGTLWGTKCVLPEQRGGWVVYPPAPPVHHFTEALTVPGASAHQHFWAQPHTHRIPSGGAFGACGRKPSTPWSWWVPRERRESTNSIYDIWKPSALARLAVGSLTSWVKFSWHWTTGIAQGAESKIFSLSQTLLSQSYISAMKMYIWINVNDKFCLR